MTRTTGASGKLQWLFFDVGDVLFDEDPQHLYLFHAMLAALRTNGVEVEWDPFYARILEAVRRDPKQFVQDAVRAFAPDAARYETIYHAGRTAYEAIRKPRPYGVLLNGITPILQELHAAGYRLGIIANQHPQILQAFADYGITPRFDVVLIDEVVGVSKPDPAIFRMALEQAGCAPEQAVMIGDRPDVDIAPARTLGMATLRFQRGALYTHYDPRTEAERADGVVRHVSQIAAAVRTLSDQSTRSDQSAVAAPPMAQGSPS